MAISGATRATQSTSIFKPQDRTKAHGPTRPKKSTVRPKRYQSYKGSVGKVAPNLLERKFEASKPNQKWVTDVTEFNIKGERIYFSPIFDLYNQEIISYEIADWPQISSVM